MYEGRDDDCLVTTVFRRYRSIQRPLRLETTAPDALLIEPVLISISPESTGLKVLSPEPEHLVQQTKHLALTSQVITLIENGGHAALTSAFEREE